MQRVSICLSEIIVLEITQANKQGQPRCVCGKGALLVPSCLVSYGLNSSILPEGPESRCAGMREGHERQDGENKTHSNRSARAAGRGARAARHGPLAAEQTRRWTAAFSSLRLWNDLCVGSTIPRCPWAAVAMNLLQPSGQFVLQGLDADFKHICYFQSKAKPSV